MRGRRFVSAILLASLVALVGCTTTDQVGVTSATVEDENGTSVELEKASDNEADDSESVEAKECGGLYLSMPFGVGTSLSAQPYGGPGKAPWQVNDSVFSSYREWDVLGERVVCFRYGLTRQIQDSKNAAFEDFRQQLASSNETLSILYDLDLDDLVPLAGFVYEATRFGAESTFDVSTLIAAKSGTASNEQTSAVDAEESPESTETTAALGQTCPELGRTAVSAAGSLECRYASGMKKVWIDPEANSEIELVGSQAVNWDACRIRDQRREVRALGTAFDITNFVRMNNPTNANIAIVPIDFPDAQANKTVSQFFDSQVNIFNSLVRQWAGNNQKYTWHMPEDWIRLPREAKYYSYDKQSVNNTTAERESAGYDQIMSTEEQAYEIFSLAEQVMDLSKIDFVFLFAWPTTEVMFPPYSHDRNVVTAAATYDWPYYGFGYHVLNDSENRPLWQFFLHELLHFRGVAGHGPRQENNELFYNVMGSGLSMYAWDSFLMGWLERDQLLCFDKDSLDESEFTLSSSDTGHSGPRTAMIRLSSTRVLVVEPRRVHRYNYFLPDGFAALHAYEVDSTKSGERLVGEIHAVYLRNDSGRSEILPNQKDSRRRFGDGVNAFPGDTFTFDGIKITYLETGKLDRVRIERID